MAIDNFGQHKASLAAFIASKKPNLFVTFNFNRKECSLQYAHSSIRTFHARVDAMLLGRHWHKKPDAERTLWVCVPEHLESNLHYHAVTFVPLKHVKTLKLNQRHTKDGTLVESPLLSLLWDKLVPGGSIYMKVVTDAKGIADYMLKDVGSFEQADRLTFSTSWHSSNAPRAA